MSVRVSGSYFGLKQRQKMGKVGRAEKTGGKGVSEKCAY